MQKTAWDLLTFLPQATLLIAFHDLLHCDFFADQIQQLDMGLKGLVKRIAVVPCWCVAAGLRGFLPWGLSSTSSSYTSMALVSLTLSVGYMMMYF